MRRVPAPVSYTHLLVGTGLGYGYWGGFFTTGELATDYIFIVFGQEMGLIGTSVIVAAFLLVVGSGLQIAQKARSEFSKLAATGLTAILGLQAFIICLLYTSRCV